MRLVRLSNVPTPKLPPKLSVPASDPLYQINVSLTELIGIVARRLTLGTFEDGESLGNFGSTQVLEFTTPATVNTEFSVFHGLGRVPYGRIIVRQDQQGILYDIHGKWSKDRVVFKSSRTQTYFKVILV